MAHEYAHSHSRWQFAPLIGVESDPQPGAIDEGFADITASIVDFKKRFATDDSRWVIGEEFTDSSTRGIRSMSNPQAMTPRSRDWFPTRRTLPDEYSRHDNSTILSHAFKLLATGGYHARVGQPIGDDYVGTIPSVFVPGLGPETMWAIFYKAFRSAGIDSDVQFLDVRNAAMSAAGTLYGENERDAVHRAFLAVGVGYSCTAPPESPFARLEPVCPKWKILWSPVSGATTYHAQANPVVYNWVQPTTIVDGNRNICTQTVSSYTHARVRACNGCGCSGWSNVVTMYPWNRCP